MAPRLAEMKARPVTQAGSDLPERKKSMLVLIEVRAAMPMASTIAK